MYRYVFAISSVLFAISLGCSSDPADPTNIDVSCTIEHSDGELSDEDIVANCIETTYEGTGGGSAHVVPPIGSTPPPVDHVCLEIGAYCTSGGLEGKCTAEHQCCTGCMQPNGVCAPFAVKTCGVKGHVCEMCNDGVCSPDGHCVKE